MSIQASITKSSFAIALGILSMCTAPLSAQTCIFEEQIHTASDSSALAEFGNAIAVSGDVAVVGAWQDNDAGPDSGAAYIFRHDGTQWNQETKLTASDGEEAEYFGQSVAIDGTIVVIGSPNAHSPQALNSGAVYVYEFNGTHWPERAKLVASDGQAETQFGYCVDISGTTILASSPHDNDLGADSGSAYIFNYNGAAWIQDDKLTASDGFNAQYFGKSAAINGTEVYIGAPFDNDNGFQSGSVYLFRDLAGSWTQLGKLLPSDGTISDQFGHALAVSGDYLAVGAINAVRSTHSFNDGAVYIFWKDHIVWTQQDKIFAFSIVDEKFGSTVALSGTRLVVQADPLVIFQNPVYTYERTGSNWNQSDQLRTAHVGVAFSSSYGDSIAITGDLVLVGNPSYDEDIHPLDIGAFSSFDLLNPPCPADLTRDCILDFFDVSAFLTAFSASDPIADFQQDDSYDFFDVSAFLTAFAAGCP